MLRLRALGVATAAAPCRVAAFAALLPLPPLTTVPALQTGGCARRTCPAPRACRAARRVPPQRAHAFRTAFYSAPACVPCRAPAAHLHRRTHAALHILPRGCGIAAYCRFSSHVLPRFPLPSPPATYRATRAALAAWTLDDTAFCIPW